MNIKKFLLSALAGLIGYIVATFPLEELIFKSYLERAFYQPIGAPTVSAANLPVSALIVPFSIVLILAYIYPKGYEGGAPAIEGLRFGVLMGLFSGIPFGIYFNLTFGIGFVPVLIQILIYTLEVSTTGLFIGLAYGRIQPKI